jgi:signal peptidase I
MRRKEQSVKVEEHVQSVAVKSQRMTFQEYSEALVVAVILAILIRAVFVQAFKIPSGSMEPTLLIGDHILVNKLVYGIRVPFTPLRWPHFSDPARGDVIVFVYPEDRAKDFIKRVIAVGGDTIEIRNKKVYINGEPADNPQARFIDSAVQPGSRRDSMPPTKVPEGHLFVMGDNRDASHDSRFWGFVPVEDIKGKAFLIYYSTYHLGRVFSLIR